MHIHSYIHSTEQLFVQVVEYITTTEESYSYTGNRTVLRAPGENRSFPSIHILL